MPWPHWVSGTKVAAVLSFLVTSNLPDSPPPVTGDPTDGQTQREVFVALSMYSGLLAYLALLTRV